jgi:hypothetical protein
LWNHELSSWFLALDALALLAVVFWLTAWHGVSRRERWG